MTREAGPAGPVKRAPSDLIAVATIALTVLLVSLPAVRGDLMMYMDNPVHLAEIRERARPGNTGWSDLAYLGFPLHLLQPPLVFGALAVTERLGLLPTEPTYVALTVVSLAAPALAFYWFSRSRLPAPWAMGLAASIVLYRGSLVGGASALGGMFGFHLAGAAFVLVLGILARQERRLRDVVTLSLLVGFIGLTHMYITIALVYLGIIHFFWSLTGRTRRGRLLYDVPALVLGATTAAAYWLPNLLARTSAQGSPEGLMRIGSRLITTSSPTPHQPLGLVERFMFDPIYHLDALPQLLILAAAAFGVQRALQSSDDGPRYGAFIAILFLALLCLEPVLHVALLGPQGLRLIWLVKIGILAMSIPIVRGLANGRFVTRSTSLVVCLVVLIAGFLSGRVVAHEAVPASDPEMVEVEQLWTWLRDHKTTDWGRVYVQDTFGDTSWEKLDQSHVLAQTTPRTGLAQFGAFYGSTPYVKSWIYGEGNYVFGLEISDPALIDVVVSRMNRASATHVVLSNARFFDRFQRDSRFLTRTRVGGFLVLELRGSQARWGRVLEGTGQLSVRRIRPGYLQAVVEGPVKRIDISEAFHPFWHVEPENGGSIRSDSEGLVVVDLPTAASSMEMIYRPPTVPALVSYAGVTFSTLILALDVVLRRRRRLPLATIHNT